MSERLLLTEKEAADQLLMDPRTLRKERQAGRIKYVALAGRKIGYRPEDCRTYVEERVKLEDPAPRPRPRPRAAGNRRSGVVIPFTARQGTGG